MGAHQITLGPLSTGQNLAPQSADTSSEALPQERRMVIMDILFVCVCLFMLTSMMSSINFPSFLIHSFYLTLICLLIIINSCHFLTIIFFFITFSLFFSLSLFILFTVIVYSSYVHFISTFWLFRFNQLNVNIYS